MVFDGCKCWLCMYGLLVAATVVAAPLAKVDPVADGFAVWRGVADKNYITGKRICPSDLRQRITVVVEVEPNDNLTDQFVKIGDLAGVNPMNAVGFNEDWSTKELPRDLIFAISVRGGTKR